MVFLWCFISQKNIMTALAVLIAIIALSSFAFADSNQFYLISIGNAYNVVIKDQEIILAENSKNFFNCTIKDDGTMQLTTGEFVTVSATTGTLGIGENTGNSSFTISDALLHFQGEQFIACPRQSNKEFNLTASSVGNCEDTDGSFNVLLRPIGPSSEIINDYPNTNLSSNSSSSGTFNVSGTSAHSIQSISTSSSSSSSSSASSASSSTTTSKNGSWTNEVSILRLEPLLGLLFTVLLL